MSESASRQKELHERIQSAGRSVLIYSFSLLKTGEIHELNNEAWIRPAEKLLEALKVLMKVERQAISFVVHEGIAQVNSHALWLDRGSNDQCQELEQYLAKREAGGVIFVSMPDEEQLRRFFTIFARHRATDDAEDMFSSMSAALEADGIDQIRLAPQPLRLEGIGQGVRGVASLWNYAKAVAGLGDLLTRIPVEIKGARRLAQQLVDACATEQDLLMAFPLLSHDRTPAKDAVDAGLMAAGVGRGLGLTAVQCADLATIAVLCNVGHAYENPDPVEFTVDESISVQVLRQLIEGSSYSPLLARRVAAAVESGRGEDGSGPPYLAGALTALPSSQLVALIRYYLEMVRGERGEPVSPLAAGLSLLSSPPSHVDPTLCRAFVAVVGLLPVGTVVELQNGDIGVVADVEHLRGRRLYRQSPAPIATQRKTFVERMRSAKGKPIAERRARVCLGEDGGDAGEWAVKRTLNQAPYRDLVVRALIRRPATVITQLGVR